MFFSPYHNQPSPYERALAQQRAIAQQQALQRARRAQYLPYDSYGESDDDDEYYSPLQFHPRDRMYLQALKQKEMERRRREEELAYQQRLEAQRQEQLRREALLQQYMSTLRPESTRRERSRSNSPDSQSHVSPAPSRSASTGPSGHTRIRIESPSPSPSPVTETMPVESTQAPPEHTSEALNEAASKIQNFYRAHRSLRTIRALSNEFTTLKSSFTLPTTLDFQGPDHVITVSTSQLPSTTTSTADNEQVPKLAYTPTNYELHAYIEALNRLLVKLDCVESWGEAQVRDERRQVVRQIEAEADGVETYWKGVWKAHMVEVAQEVNNVGSEELETTKEEMLDVDVNSAETQPVVVNAALSEPQDQEDSIMENSEETTMENSEETTQQPTLDTEAAPTTEHPISTDPEPSHTQDESVELELPELVVQGDEDSGEMDSDDSDFLELEGAVTPEEEQEPLPVLVADPEVEMFPGVDVSLDVPLKKKEGELEGDFEMV